MGRTWPFLPRLVSELRRAISLKTTSGTGRGRHGATPRTAAHNGAPPRQPPAFSSAEPGEGAQERSVILKTLRCYFCHLDGGSELARQREGAGPARLCAVGPPLPPYTALTNHPLKTREGNLVALNGLYGVSLVQIYLH